MIIILFNNWANCWLGTRWATAQPLGISKKGTHRLGPTVWQPESHGTVRTLSPARYE